MMLHRKIGELRVSKAFDRVVVQIPDASSSQSFGIVFNRQQSRGFAVISILFVTGLFAGWLTLGPVCTLCRQAPATATDYRDRSQRSGCSSRLMRCFSIPIVSFTASGSPGPLEEKMPSGFCSIISQQFAVDGA